MKQDGLWWKLSVAWPCAATDWLYANSVVPLRAGLKAFLTELTLRKLIYAAAFTVAAYTFAQIAAGEIVLLMAGDLALYVEIASFFYLAVARNQLSQIFAMVRQGTRRLMTRVRATVRARRPPRSPRLFDSGDCDDEPDGAMAFA